LALSHLSHKFRVFVSKSRDFDIFPKSAGPRFSAESVICRGMTAGATRKAVSRLWRIRRRQLRACSDSESWPQTIQSVPC
jgi:hypothetical protein